MKIEYDPNKSRMNAEQRGLPFSMVSAFEMETALIRLDIRRSYGEPRFNALGYIEKGFIT